ncbi:hypothetical protein DPMN_097316 [Dreissena polymorpha]|uniref:Uncharacterized protein n=1 Tax=Dreissena polymorpha TaxID=45954 RepID=A0A9D4LA28_DREPO|nr:hypothetical protein DPMN_097316 [Dreissena polymorpha]
MKLEKSEHGRETALRDELIRQERLEQLAQRFRRKVGTSAGTVQSHWAILDILACDILH